ncbi:unnamed protein product [Mycena citricolor]|uniref:Uncharacterized protein n=1 Tax=Mycena citricolor TaxID=2018698 RepID=A0AAD2HUV0_9AGAR|nr:unnamed protein product [Mycena citricolor]
MVPPLPKITGDVDIILDVYSHESLKMGDERNIDYGDTGRLIELGEKAIQMALTFHFFNKRPMLDVEEIQVCVYTFILFRLPNEFRPEAKASIATVLSDENLREWLTAYNIKSKYKAAPNTVDILNSPEEMRKFFKSYAGALQHRNGLNHVISWITALVDPDAQPNSLVKAMSSSSISEDHDSPLAPDSPAPPLPNSPASQTAPKAVEGNFSLLIFNQTASKKE